MTAEEFQAELYELMLAKARHEARRAAAEARKATAEALSAELVFDETKRVLTLNQLKATDAPAKVSS